MVQSKRFKTVLTNTGAQFLYAPTIVGTQAPALCDGTTSLGYNEAAGRCTESIYRIQQVGVRTTAQCAAACDANSACTAFDLSAYNSGWCQIYTKCILLSGFASRPHYKKCSPLPPPPSPPPSSPPFSVHFAVTYLNHLDPFREYLARSFSCLLT